MNEALKKLLGENLAAQVEAALKGKGKEGKDLDLLIDGGNYVTADKLEAEKQSRISAENALKTAAAELKGIGGSGDPAKISEDLKGAQTKISGLETSHKRELDRIKRNFAVKTALTGKAHDPNDIISLLDMEKIEVDGEGNLKSNIDDLIKPFKESKPYLFVEEKSKEQNSINLSGVKPADPNSTKPQPADDMDKWRAEAGL